MPAFRILDQAPVYFDEEGKPVENGEVRFYETGTTTAKAVYGNKALNVNLGSVVGLGSDGRLESDVWGDGAYRVRLYRDDGTMVPGSERDNVEISGGSGSSLPALVPNGFLTSDGAVLSWQTIQQVPDPTGSADKVLSNDGTNVFWKTVANPVAPDPQIVVTTAKMQAGVSTNTTKKLFQTGTGSAAASGNKATSANVSFPEAFTALEHVGVTITNNAVTSSGAVPKITVTTSSGTGFTVNFSTTTGGTSADNFSGSNIINAVPFTWFAIGTKVIP